jgi:DNA modification methylase
VVLGVKYYHKNPRQITHQQFGDLKKWLAQLGDLGGIVHNLPTDEVIGGNQRARVFDINDCEIVVEHELDEPDEQGTVGLGYVIWQGHRYSYRQVAWDEKTCEQANIVANKAGGDWDWDILANQWEVSELLEWGFEESELQLDWGNDATPDPGAQVDKAAELQEKWQVQRGQIWQVGRHRVMCGDSTSAEDVARLMRGERAVLMNTDPPYGIAYGHKGTQNWKGEVDRLKIASDQFQDDDLQVFLEDCFRNAVSLALVPNAAWYLWHAHLTQGFFAAAAAAAANVILHRQIIWVKPSLILGMGMYHWRHEPCFMGWVEGNQPPDYGDRKQTTVWEIGRQRETGHPTEKPVALFVIPIEKHTKPGEGCYEPFCGSGSQLVACEQTNRIGYGMEIEPKYVAVTLERLSQMGLTPKLIED